jgi:hypothetical protein
MYTETVTKLIHKAVEKGKKVYYIVLKSFHKEIIEQIEKELEVKMIEFMEKIAPKLKEDKFENKEQSLKYIILKGLIIILEKELAKNKINLSNQDKKILKEIMDNDDDNDICENEKKEKESNCNLMKNEKKEEINNEDNKRMLGLNVWWYSS